MKVPAMGYLEPERLGTVPSWSCMMICQSIMRETGHLFIGRQLTQVEAVADETEFLEVALFPFAQALQMVIESEIRDSMSVIAILHAARLRGEWE